MVSEEILRRAAHAAFTNTKALYDEARLLYESQRYARAAALAVVAAEDSATTE